MYFKLALCVLLAFIDSSYNDFVVGMFQRHDYLVAQDMYYKERIPHRSVVGQYGRKVRCPITYFRVIDRLGVGRGPGVRIIRGGLRKNYVVLSLTSIYNMPLAANIYIGCQNIVEQPTTGSPNGNNTNGNSTGSGVTGTGNPTGETTAAEE